MAGKQHQFEAVLDLVDAVLNRDAGHVCRVLLTESRGIWTGEISSPSVKSKKPLVNLCARGSGPKVQSRYMTLGRLRYRHGLTRFDGTLILTRYFRTRQQEARRARRAASAAGR